MDSLAYNDVGIRCKLLSYMYSVQGDRNYQEDQVLRSSDDNFIYYAVFDGHGGKEASAFAKNHLIDHLKRHGELLDDDPERVCEAIKSGFADTQAAMEVAADSWPKTASGHRSTSGTTVSLAMVDKRRPRLFVAHLGDSRVVLGHHESEGAAKYSDASGSVIEKNAAPQAEPLLPEPEQADDEVAIVNNIRRGVAACGSSLRNSSSFTFSSPIRVSSPVSFIPRPNTQWTASALTVDHKPENKTELARIENRGGSVMLKYNVWRVVWMRPNEATERFDCVPFLAIARSLGDLWSYNASLGQYVVSPEPDVSCVEISSSMRCLVLGTDGLFNVMNNIDVIDTVQKIEFFNERFNLYYTAGARDPSKELVNEALTKWRRNMLRSDNISVVTVVFRRCRKPLRCLLPIVSPSVASSPSSTAVISSWGTLSSSSTELAGRPIAGLPPPRLPLNHLNQNRNPGTKRSRSVDSVLCSESSEPKFQRSDSRDEPGGVRSTKRSSSSAAGSLVQCSQPQDQLLLHQTQQKSRDHLQSSELLPSDCESPHGGSAQRHRDDSDTSMSASDGDSLHRVAPQNERTAQSDDIT